jgi:replicative superfamily II helicase
MLFTNGTGTGKTFSGLGIVRRFASQGKTNTLIVVPDEKIGDDWIESAKALELTVSRLTDTKDAGQGIVITTYANLGANDELARRDWDLVVADEAHTLMQSKDGDVTLYLNRLRAISLHPDGRWERHAMLHRDVVEGLKAATRAWDQASKMLNAASDDRDRPALRAALDKAAAKRNELEAEHRRTSEAVKADVAARQGAARTRAAFLTATPFPY